MKKIVCFSGGHSSALAAIETARKYGTEGMILLNHDISLHVEHEDIKRFTAISTTNISAMLDELGKTGSTVAGILQERTGKSFAELMGSGEDLGGVMAILADSVDGDATAFNNLWSSSTAGKAALTLLNEGAEEFTRTLGVIEFERISKEEAYHG